MNIKELKPYMTTYEMHTITCDYCNEDYEYEVEDYTVACLPDGYFTGGNWICDECGSCPVCGKTLEKEPEKRGNESKDAEPCKDCDYYFLDPFIGVPVDELEDHIIVYHIDFHERQVRNNQVGTPNVYVRLGDLKREADKRGIII